MYHHLLQKAGQITIDVLGKSFYAVLLSPVVLFFQEYIFSDFEFLKWIAIAVVLDTLLGFGYAVWKRNIDPDKFGDILVKIVVYICVLISGHVIENFTVSGDTMPGGDYLKMVAYSGLILKEILSILKKLALINKKLVPSWLIKRLKDFDETGDFNNLKNPPKDE